MHWYDLPTPEPLAPQRTTPPAVDRPAWAKGLPSHTTLVYVRDLGTATIVAIVGLYLIARALRDPSAALRAIRARAGV